MIAKPFWQSKTLWFNLLIVLLFVIDGIQAGQILSDYNIDPEVLLFLSGLGNLVLRFTTSRPLTLRG